MKITAIIAAKNEGQSIRKVVDVTTQYVDECIVVVPISDMNTREPLIGSDCRIVNETAKGKGSALLTGAQVATGDILLFIDADLSHDPRDIPHLVAPIVNGDCDHVVASRMLGGSSELYDSLANFIRLIGSHIITLAINLKFGSKLTDSQNGYRAIRRDVFLSLDLQETHTTIEQELTAKTLSRGYRMIELPSHEYSRVYGESKINVFKHGPRYVMVLIRILTSRKNQSTNHDYAIELQKKYRYAWYLKS